jgi:nitronate monooxygenase
MIMDAFLKLFSIREPIVQAPIGGAATVDLVKAVAKGGGVGSLAGTWTDLEGIKHSVTALNAADVPYFLNFVLHFQRQDFHEIFDLGLKAIQFSWGVDRALIAEAKSRGITVGVQVGHVEAAVAALAAGCDFLIVQGNEAGGHVQSTQALMSLLPVVVARAGQTPVIAAGGIASTQKARLAIAAGASGVMMGTRFLASTESLAHTDVKAALCKAKASDTVFTNCFDKGWPHAMHRVLRNRTLEQWEAAGCPQAPHRPGETDTILTHANGQQAQRYSDMEPLVTDKGSVLEACLYAGTGVEDIHEVIGAAEVVKRVASSLR